MTTIRLLYIGNKLSRHGNTATSIETLGPLLEAEGFSVRYASFCKNRFFRMADMLWATLRHGFSTHYVIIDTYSTTNFWYAFLVSQMCRLMGVKYIPVLRGGNLPQRIGNSPITASMIFSNAYRNVAPSGYLMSAFEKAGFPNVIHIPNTLELIDYPYKFRSSVAPRLLWVRSFSPIYNPKMAIDVIAGLLPYFPDAVLCMVGPDKNGYLSEITAYAKMRNVNVEFPGRLSKPEWRKLSEEYDIFINTTHFDNTPVSVMEAMALGLPVVSTNVGGIPFLLEHGATAILVNDSADADMIQGISGLISDTGLARTISAKALEKVKMFDWAEIRVKWLEILKQP